MSHASSANLARLSEPELIRLVGYAHMVLERAQFANVRTGEGKSWRVSTPAGGGAGAHLSELQLESLEHGSPHLVIKRRELSVRDGTQEAFLELSTSGDQAETRRADLQVYISLVQELTAQYLKFPDGPVSEWSLLSAEDEQRLLQIAGPLVSENLDRSVPELILEQCRKQPTATALIAEDRKVSFGELADQCARVVDTLDHLKLKNGDVVAVYAPRSIDLFAVLAGLMVAGVTVAPLDWDLPPERLAVLVSRLAPALILVDGGYEADFSNVGAVMTIEDCLSPAIIQNATRAPHVPLTSAAYVLFTSGSTGVPKGVITGHAALANRIAWMARTFSVQSGDVVLQKTPLSFDVSVWEIFLPLAYGATLAILKPGAHRDPTQTLAAFDHFGVTIAHFVPSMLHLYINEPTTTPTKALRLLICSGESLTRELSDTAEARLGIKPTNLYGPTEAAIDVTWRSAALPIATDDCPIGSAIDNLDVTIRDEVGRKLPLGAVGEICIAGVGLADGYLDSPEETRKRFVVVTPSQGGERVYRTGDLGRVDKNGEIVWLGRLDRQVKIGGVRIELGEIEAHIKALSGVSDVVVEAVSERVTKLTAWVLVTRGTAVDQQGIRAVLSAKLPSVAVPSVIHVMNAWPTGQNGKVNRQALLLSQEAVAAEKPSGDVVAVRDEISEEAALLALLFDVVGHSPDLSKSIFELGASSLSAIKFISRVRSELLADLGVADLFVTHNCRSLIDLAQARPRLIRSQTASSSVRQNSLSQIQRRLWLDYLRNPSSRRFELPFAVSFPAECSVAVEQTARDVLTPPSPLGAHLIGGVGDEVTMSAAKASSGTVIRVASEADERDYAELYESTFPEPLSLEQHPLGRWAVVHFADRTILFVSIHHIIFDERSWELLTTAFCKALVGHPEALIWTAESSYEVDAHALEKARHYWQELLNRAPESLAAPQNDEADVQRYGQVHERRVSLNPLTTSRLRSISTLTTSPLFLASFGTILSDWCDGEGSTICVAASTRTPGQLNELGFHVNMLPVAISPDWSKSFRDFYARVASTVGEALEHRGLPFEEIIQTVAESRDDYRTFGDFAFVYREQLTSSNLLSLVGAQEHRIPELESRYQLKLEVSQTHDSFVLTLVGGHQHFSIEQLGWFLDRLVGLLEAIATDADLDLHQLMMKV